MHTPHCSHSLQHRSQYQSGAAEPHVVEVSGRKSRSSPHDAHSRFGAEQPAWGDDDAIREEMELEANGEYHINTILSKVRALR